jgi:hypothetical protein
MKASKNNIFKQMGDLSIKKICGNKRRFTNLCATSTKKIPDVH